MELKAYDSNNLVSLSDHRPVFAQFLIKVSLSELFKKVTTEAHPLTRAVAGNIVKASTIQQTSNTSPSTEKAKAMQKCGTQEHINDIALRKTTGEVS